MLGALMKPRALSTRDAQLPAAYSDRLESLSLAPLWTALHALLPPRAADAGGAAPLAVERAAARRCSRPARLVPIEQAERRVLVLLQSRAARQLLGDRHALRGPADHPARRGGAQPPSHRGRAAPDRRGRGRLHHGGRREVRDGAGRFHHHPADALARPRPRGPRAGDLAGRPRHPAGAQRRGQLGLGHEARGQPRRPRPTPPRTSSPRPGLVPRQSRYEETGYPQVRWPWRTARAALAAMAATAPRRAPVVLRHVNPRTGEYPLQTMGSEARWLRPGEETRRGAPHRERGGPRDRGAGREPGRRPDARLAGRRRLRGAAVALDRASQPLGPRPRPASSIQRRARAPRARALAENESRSRATDGRRERRATRP